jgi:SpoVK/Ycf46/Vps4 family AAA+-type ATPase
MRIRHRSRVAIELGFERHLPLGKGLVALFSGSSGTGKTFAAELLAGEQGVDLYKVDLSAVVSKYVGETEKNLERVFTEAERANALLFFDEADALFGKRGEVKEARDRWANLEINFLLQRIEEYPGIVILTTNLRQNIDEAFLRRIQVLVEFPFPDEDARLDIWRRLFPDEVGRPDDAVLRSLARRFRLPGGGIKNVVVDAAHRAAADAGDGPPRITRHHLGIALVREYQKLGKPVTRSEFGDDLYRIFEAELA